MKFEFSEIQTIVTKNSIIYNRYLKRCPNLPGPQGRRSWYQEDDEFGEENINSTEISLNFFSFLTLKCTMTLRLETKIAKQYILTLTLSAHGR